MEEYSQTLGEVWDNRVSIIEKEKDTFLNKLGSMQIAKCKEILWEKIAEEIDLHTGDLKEEQSTDEEGLEQLEKEKEEAVKEYERVKAALMDRQENTPKEIASQLDLEGEKHLCNASPLPYLDEVIPKTPSLPQSQYINDLEVEGQTFLHRLASLSGELEKTLERANIIAEFADDADGVAFSALDKLVAEETSDSPDSPNSAKRKRNGPTDPDETPRTAIRRKMVAGLKKKSDLRDF